jgi:hypothetical protein
MTEGLRHRHVASTRENEDSSRSHSVFTLYIESKEIVSSDSVPRVKYSRLNIVDLAGSERQKVLALALALSVYLCGCACVTDIGIGIDIDIVAHRNSRCSIERSYHDQQVSNDTWQSHAFVGRLGQRQADAHQLSRFQVDLPAKRLAWWQQSNQHYCYCQSKYPMLQRDSIDFVGMCCQ